MSKKDLAERMRVTMQNMDKLTKQLRETQDYSQQAEVYFLLNELILEQTINQENENSNHPTHQTG